MRANGEAEAARYRDSAVERAARRPVKYPLSDAVPDSPENTARTIFAGSPKKERCYLKDQPSARRGQVTDTACEQGWLSQLGEHRKLAPIGALDRGPMANVTVSPTLPGWIGRG